MIPKADDILESIRKIDQEFIINNDPDLTKMVKQSIEKVNLLSRKSKNITSEEDIMNSLQDINQLKTLIKLLEESKDITNQIPENTRFKFIKKIINRVIQFSTRPQEHFNEYLVRFNKILIKQAEAQSVYSNENIKSQISEVLNGIERKQYGQYNVEAKTLEEKIMNLENEVKFLYEKQSGTNNWLNLVSQSIEGNSKWIEATNKRIDSHDKIIEYIPETKSQSFSQSGEDLIIDYIMRKYNISSTRNLYLDIGANHYKYFNNTFKFYQNGFTGVLVEANPHLIDDLKNHRPKDSILNCGVSANTGDTLDFHIIKGEGISSFCKEFIDKASENDRNVQISEVISIKTRSLNNIIEKEFTDCPVLVSIDTEGTEIDILRTWNYESYRPFLFIIETIAYSSGLSVNKKRNDIINLMSERNYAEYAFTGINSIFIDELAL